MKILFYGLLFFTAASVFAQGATFMVQPFRDVVMVASPADILVPTVVEVPLTGLVDNSTQVLVTRAQTGEAVPSRYESKTVKQPAQLQAMISGDIQRGYYLIDNNLQTTTDFHLVGDEPTVSTFSLISEVPVSSSAINFHLAQYVALPNSIKITAVNNGLSYILVSNHQMTGTKVVFPETVAETWLIEVTHSQPLRLSEVQLIQSQVEETRTQSVRFLALPGESYNIYLNPDSYVTLPRLESSNFESNDEVLTIAPLPKQTNRTFKEADSDRDNVVDRLDNCVNISNFDQLDIDGNGRGDACDDWDRDGIINSTDSCPSVANRSQTDEDGDGIGDACDQEESRFTERHSWVSWVGLVFAAGTILGMFLLVRRKEEVIESELE